MTEVVARLQEAFTICYSVKSEELWPSCGSQRPCSHLSCISHRTAHVSRSCWSTPPHRASNPSLHAPAAGTQRCLQVPTLVSVPATTHTSATTCGCAVAASVASCLFSLPAPSYRQSTPCSKQRQKQQITRMPLPVGCAHPNCILVRQKWLFSFESLAPCPA